MAHTTVSDHVVVSADAGRAQAHQDLTSTALIPAPVETTGADFERWHRRVFLAFGLRLAEHSDGHRFTLYDQRLAKEEFDAADTAYHDAFNDEVIAWPLERLLADAQRATAVAACQGITPPPGKFQLVAWQ
ncbi:hypothetical protein [Catenulispora subtropica]|uniref:Uncharacterized protein n=1 Tax=Catenulispora subtropica TaxID=450798 RepID=A0ABN2R5F7_9ACTN